ncbi:MAG: TonB-dependent receptor [Porticoccaceae bacterium]
MKLAHKKLIALGVATASLAAAAPSQTLAQSSYALEEIVVVAQRREQSLQDVPISIQAFSETSLLDAGVNNVGQLGMVTPSLNMTQQLLSFTPSIRGVGSPDASVGQESTVAMYVDGVYIANSNASIFAFNSVDRVEVLKGPQGTLFGRNATGGLVHVITKDPSHDAHLKGAVSYGNYDTAGVKLYGTTGLSDAVAADLAVFYRDQGEGWGDNLTTGTDVNKTEEFGIRSKWLIEAGENTQIRLTADYAELESSVGIQKALVPGSVGADGQLYFAGCVAQLGGNPAAPTPQQFGTCQPIAAASATRAPDDYHDSYGAIPEENTSETWGLSARIDHSFGDLDFVSISAYRDSEVTMYWEQGGFPIPMVVIDIDKQGYETFSQEFQLMSQGDKLDWILGAYIYNDESGFVRPYGIGISGLAVGATQNILALIDTESYALFGELTYALTERTKLTAGLRWTKDKRSIDQEVFLNGNQIAAIEQSEEWDEPTWRLVLDHQINDDVMVYGSYSRGFKSGNYNVSGVGTPAVEPEFIDAYELGIKSSLADGRVQLSAATYFYDYKDLQLARIEGGSLVTVNAASAEIMGFEMDLLANVTSRLQVRGGISWMDTEYTRFPDAPVYVPNALGLGLGGNDLVALDLSGKSLARAPDVTFNVGGTYTVPVAVGDITVGANYYYNDGYGWEPSGRIEQDSYALINGFVSWRHPADTWGIRVFADNISDEEYQAFVTEQALGDHYASAPPRTYGIELSFSF